MAYLECRNLRRNYDAFNLELNLDMQKGELLSIIGPSGSGKSTLLSLISGIESVDSGSIILDGVDITDMAIQKRSIGMVFQDFSLFPSMNVAQNIQYGMKTRDQGAKDKRTAELLSLVGLSGYESRKVFELSGGEAQRIALARAVAAEPQMLLLDEPLSALDAPLRKKLRTVIRHIHDNTGITMLYVTHDREEAFAISDRILVMRGGHMEAIGTPEDLYNNPPTLFAATFTGEGSVLEQYSKTLFFRPESIILDNVESYDASQYLKLCGCEVQSVEYAGNGYGVKLDYKGTIITAFTAKRPAQKAVDLMVKWDDIRQFD
ncbi:MAG: ABC transporter ATP-binding protein [Sphaerochaetaceae bacterium]|nr:ABC transporter ATP-binding protein [Sphaerochaetaceae bacterium]